MQNFNGNTWADVQGTLDFVSRLSFGQDGIDGWVATAILTVSGRAVLITPTGVIQEFISYGQGVSPHQALLAWCKEHLEFEYLDLGL